ncbi:SpoIID/LytB domain-containing protein [Prochlorococcus marinus]|uniref:SpoIID/LytB domain-containing protein n=1 Tax=Prochlorococcus marinus TaxID=1219 RepID=UPI0022B31A5B|nr:SpoIID/LytB domain-containing protein [Prochlorococcus marinus]
MNSFFVPKVFFCSLLLLLDFSNYEYRAEDAQILPTHFSTTQPLPFKDSQELLVSLETYLGKPRLDGSHAADLKLVSPGRPIFLKDSKGLTHKAAQITISWQRVDLQRPLKFVRQVIGPFASFESAQRVSELLRQEGIPSLVAYPSDWEVWISEGHNIPENFNSRIVQKNVFFKVKPVLKLGSIDFLISGDLEIFAPDGLFWKGGLYSGPFYLKPDAYGSWSLIEKVPIEKYLLGVLPHEIGSSSPPAALAAQAVLARTWAISNRKRFEIDGYHLCSNTQCQVYKDPNQSNDAVARAISSTAGKILSWNGQPINAVYHATNGGVGAAGNEAWSMASLPYLKTFLDGSTRWRKQFSLPLNEDFQIQRLLKKRDGAFGNNHRLFRWKRVLKAEEIKEKLALTNLSTFLPKTINILKRGTSGRVLALEIQGSKKNSKIILRLDAIRRNLRNLPSTLFYVEQIEEGSWQFIGGGFGHGAGLSQAGAIDLAHRGWTTKKILKHYYPGTTYESFE